MKSTEKNFTVDQIMTPKQLREKISRLPEFPPITGQFERDTRGGQRVWYKSQKEHWLGWLADFPGPGAYGRKKWINPSAEFVYNHLVCPPMVLWLGEACRVPKKKVIEAKQAALSAGSTFNAQCGAIRKIITWEMIEVALIRMSSKCCLEQG